jgi:hypothetical protein
LDIKSLHLANIRVAGDEIANSNPSRCVMHLLSSIGKSGRLEEIKLDMNIPGSQKGQVDWSAWEGVDCILARADFEFLRKVDIELWPVGNIDPDWFRKTCGNLADKLPLSEARGILVHVH